MLQSTMKSRLSMSLWTFRGCSVKQVHDSATSLYLQLNFIQLDYCAFRRMVTLLCYFNFLLLIGTSNSITYYILTVCQFVFHALIIWHCNGSLLLAMNLATCFNWELLCSLSSNWSFPLCIVPNKTPGETVL